jgi:hypothetical protein
LAFGFAAFFSAAGFFAAVFFGVLAILGLAAFGFTTFFGLAAGFVSKRKRRVFQTSHPEVYYGQLQC